jgi:protein-S-isoprenylcysteine O-methyltransferase Ste14
MNSAYDSPGVYIPPPLFYVLIFLVAIFVQGKFPIDDSFFHTQIAKIAGIVFLAGSLFFIVSSLRKFFQSKNTLVLIKPASSLQTNGVYGISRNPMYIGLGILYIGITCLAGNWWNIIFLPFLFLIIREYIVKKEEKYLERAFGEAYLNYKRKVRRWF